MALFGNFEDMPLPEILSVAGRQCGKFQIRQHPSVSAVDLHLQEGFLLAVEANGEELQDDAAVQGVVVALLKESKGEFEFTKTETSELKRLYQIQLDQLFLTCFSMIDEIEAYAEHFPNRYTYFKYAQFADDASTDSSLRLFCEENHQELFRGVNADTIARMRGIDLEFVQLQIFKLRSAGILRPLRGWETRQAAQSREESRQVLSPVATGGGMGWDLSGVQLGNPAAKPGLINRITNFLHACWKG